MAVVIHAVVRAVKGNRSPFVIAHPLPGCRIEGFGKKTEITFPLTFWKDAEQPHPGQTVQLEGMRKYHKGWRATQSARLSRGINIHQ